MAIFAIDGLENLEKKSEYKMLLKVSFPVILSLLFQAIYSLIDSIYLSKLGEKILSAVSLAFVVQSLAVSLFSGIATGTNALLSRSIGEDNYNKAHKVVINGIFTQLILIAAFALFGAFGVKSYYMHSTTDNSIIDYGISYLRPCMLFVFSGALQLTFERLLQSAGLSKLTLVSQGIGAICNIVLDPIFIFGCGIMPRLGVSGAAYATIVSQCLALVLALIFNLKYNYKVLFKSKKQSFISLHYILKICCIGIPASAVTIGAAIGNYYINIILIGFESTANAAFGIYTKLQSIALMTINGMHVGILTVLSFFYGRKNALRMKNTIVSGESILFILGLLNTIAFICFPGLLLKPFNPTLQMIEVGIPCFRIIGLTYLPSNMMSGISAFLHSVGKSYLSLFVALGRQFFVRIPVALLLARTGNPNTIWWCWPISEITSDILIIIFFKKTYSKTISTLNPIIISRGGLKNEQKRMGPGCN